MSINITSGVLLRSYRSFFFRKIQVCPIVLKIRSWWFMVLKLANMIAWGWKSRKIQIDSLALKIKSGVFLGIRITNSTFKNCYCELLKRDKSIMIISKDLFIWFVNTNYSVLWYLDHAMVHKIAVIDFRRWICRLLTN